MTWMTDVIIIIEIQVIKSLGMEVEIDKFDHFGVLRRLLKNNFDQYGTFRFRRELRNFISELRSDRKRDRSKSPSPRREIKKSKSKSPSPSRSKSRSKSPSKSKSRSRSPGNSPSDKESEELPKEALIALIKKREEDLEVVKKRLMDVYKKESEEKQPLHFFIPSHNYHNQEIKLNPEQTFIYGDITNLLVSVDKLKEYYNKLQTYTYKLSHLINLYMYKYEARLMADSLILSQISELFESQITSMLEKDTYVFEIQSKLNEKSENVVFPFDTYFGDISNKPGDKIIREIHTLVTYHPNTAIYHALTSRKTIPTIIIHKLSSKMKAISVSDLCDSYSNLGVLLIEKGFQIEIKDTKSCEVSYSSTTEPEKILPKKTINIIYTEITK